MDRTTEVLKKIAPDWSEGKIYEKEDFCGDIVKELGKREQKWAVALMSDQLLNDSANSELRSMLGFSESESIALMQVTTMKLATKTTKVASMTAKTVEEIAMTGPMIVM